MSQYTPAEDRYDVSEHWFRRCGDSGLKLPAVSLGCWHNFGDAGTDAAKHDDEAAMHENARQMLFAAFDYGITHFDLANNYGPAPGAAETRVGRILRQDFAGHRDELIISSKAGWGMWPGPYGDRGSRKYLIASCDQSLRRLQLDYVDIFYHHRPDPGTPLEETLGALDQIVRSGKALYCGISSYSGAMTAEVMRLCRRDGLTRPIIHQPSYSMLNRKIEKDLLPVTGEQGIGVIAFCPLAQGQLTDKYLKGIPADSRAKQPSGALKKARITPEVIEKVGKLNHLAKQRGQTLAQLALLWVLRGGKVTTALIGASRPEQIQENAKLLDQGPLSDDEAEAIENVLDEGKDG